MAAVSHAEENGYAERVIRTINEEEAALNEYPDLETILKLYMATIHLTAYRFTQLIYGYALLQMVNMVSRSQR